MTTLASLRILLGLDAGGVKSGGSGVRGELRGIQQEANRTQQTLSQIGKGAAAGLGIGAGLGAFQVASRAVGEFTSFLGDSVKAAAAEEVSIARLTSSLKANVPAWDGQVAAIEATLTARAKLGFSDDEQRESLARLVAATHDVNEALALQRTAMDLAAFKSVDLLTASTALIKVDGGQFRALKELIGSTKDITTAEEALAAVHEATAGAAEALANTNSGKLKASQIAIDEAMEKFGTVIMPAVATGTQIAADALTALADNINRFLPAIEVIAVGLGVKVVSSLAAAAAGALGFGAASAESAVASTAATNVIVANAARQAAAAAGGGAVAVAGAAASVGAAEVGIGARIAAGASAAVVPVALLTADLILLKGVYDDAAAAGRKLAAEGGGGADAAANGAAELARQTAFLSAEVAKGTITQEQADTALQKLRDSYGTVGLAAIAAASAHGTATDTLGILSDTTLVTATATDELTAASLRYAQALTGSTTSTEADAAAKAYLAIVANDLRLKHDQLTDAFGTLFVPAKEAPQVFGRVADAATNAGGEMVTAADQAKALGASLAALPTLTELEVVTRFREIAEGAGGRNVAEKVGAAGDPDAATGAAIAAANTAFLNDQAARDKAAADARAAAAKAAAAVAKSAAERANAEALQAAQKAAAEQAAAYRDKLSGAFDAVRHAAETYFAKLHDLNLKAIKDAHDHANALLDAQKAANLAPVNEAQAAQAAIVQQRELAARQAALANATTPEDRLAATQALADFNAAARIAAMQANADAANAQIDVEKAKNDALAATATQAENDRATAQREAFANDLKALEDSLSKHPETWAKTQQAILKLLMGYGVDYKKAGQALTDQFAAGLLASTLNAENAARAVFNSASGVLGAPAKPPVGAGAGASSAAVAESLGDMRIDIHNHLYLNGQEVLDWIDREQASRYSRVGSGIGG